MLYYSLDYEIYDNLAPADRALLRECGASTLYIHQLVKNRRFPDYRSAILNTIEIDKVHHQIMMASLEQGTVNPRNK